MRKDITIAIIIASSATFSYPASAQVPDSVAVQKLRNENFHLKVQVRDLQSRLERYEKRYGNTGGISSLDEFPSGTMDGVDDGAFSILDHWDDLTTVNPQDLPAPKSLEVVNALIGIPHDRVLDKYVDIYTIQRKSMMMRVLARYDKLESMFTETFREYGVPEELTSLCIVESAVNQYALSSAGAAGLWQIMPGTARDHGLTVSLFNDQRYDPQLSTRVAAQCLRNLHSRLGSWGLALMAYNCGEGALRKAIDKNGGRTDYETLWRYLPKETRDYLPALVAVMYVNQNRDLIYETY